MEGFGSMPILSTDLDKVYKESCLIVVLAAFKSGYS